MNYKTGIDSVKFKIESFKKESRVWIDIINKDEGIREIYFEQFQELPNLLPSELNNLNWIKKYRVYSEIYVSRIYTELKGTLINRESEWTDIHIVLEKKLIAIHEFWGNSKEIFVDLKK